MLTYSLPGALAAAVRETLGDWRSGAKARRLWSGDASLWTSADEGRWLGWLGVAAEQSARLPQLRAAAEDARGAGFTHALLLGMGGSSLCPEVLARTFGRREGFPELRVLDSTDPAQVLGAERWIDPGRTLFIVSSKSGGTLEPGILKEYFFERVRRSAGPAEAGRRFIAITDPGSALQRMAEKERFRQVYFGAPSIGGRYSALSSFGLVPAAIMGLDVARLLDRAQEMVRRCGPDVPPEENPGVQLGVILGVLGRAGRDKVTLLASPAIRDLGAWLEQLLAESTGKQGKGLIPVDLEAPGAPGAYGSDRLFIYLRLDSAFDPAQDLAVDALEKARQPVVRLRIADLYDLGQEFFRWEMATAVAGAVLGLNPFDQPDVETSKVVTRRLTDEYEATGALPSETPIASAPRLQVYADARNAAALDRLSRDDRTPEGYLRAHLRRLGAGDYFAILAYLERSDAQQARLQMLRHAVRDAARVATCLGFGPRFLHSTGQVYKGGPNSGLFLQITCDDGRDVPIPGRKCTFGVVKAAQARGDFQVLAERGRRALRVHLGPDVEAGLAALGAAAGRALA